MESLRDTLTKKKAEVACLMDESTAMKREIESFHQSAKTVCKLSFKRDLVDGLFPKELTNYLPIFNKIYFLDQCLLGDEANENTGFCQMGCKALICLFLV